MCGVLKSFAHDVHAKEGYTLNAANEIEGFIFAGLDAERRFPETGKFEYVNTGGYYHSCPAILRVFIDTAAEVLRSMGFENEKTIRRWHLRSLRSTTATARWLRQPIRSRSTNWSVAR